MDMDKTEFEEDDYPEEMSYEPEPALGGEDPEEGEAALKAWEAENEQSGNS